MKKHPDGRLLEADKLFRISYLMGIFKALNILHGQPLADEWVRLPNTNRIFGGASATCIHGERRRIGLANCAAAARCTVGACAC